MQNSKLQNHPSADVMYLVVQYYIDESYKQNISKKKRKIYLKLNFPPHR